MTAHRTRRRTRQWRDLSRTQKSLTVVLGSAELIVTAVAARDLATRDSAQVRGPKAIWALALAVQPLGAIAYLAIGRRGTFSSTGDEPTRGSSSR